jgi:hypothetical protein
MFYLKLMSTLFSETAVLHESLQHAELDIVTAKNNAETCVEKLRALQSSENDFDDFFDTVVQMAKLNGIPCEDMVEDDVVITRCASNKLRDSVNSNAKEKRDRFRKRFNEVIDNFVDHISSKFSEENIKPIITIFSLLNESEMTSVDVEKELSIYSELVDFVQLRNELKSWFL